MDAGLYRARRPCQTPLYALLEALYEDLKGAWEDLFESRYGFWRRLLDGVVHRYLDCGLFDRGFARIRCPSCRQEHLLAFSCKGRGLCPSCGAKRAVAFAAFLRDEVVADVGHAQWVFTIPKMLRPYFMHQRRLLGPLCTAAWQTVRELMVAAADDQAFRPGMVAVVQTFGDQLNMHPHVHALVTRGGWAGDGTWLPMPYVSATATEELFRHKILRLLQREGLLDEDRTRLLLSWHHSGFSVHNSVTVPAGDGRALEALARYCLRSPVSLARLRWVPGSPSVQLLAGDDQPALSLDARDFVARVLAHVPDPRRHLVHYYGAYSSVVRGRMKAASQPPDSSAPPPPPEPGLDPLPPLSPAVAATRRRWRDLIRRVYETDPLLCPRCGSLMRVVAFITSRPVIRAILDHLARRIPEGRAQPA